MKKEFVIHIHTGYGPTHYDLMLDRGGSLATWQLASSPVALEQNDKLRAKKLKDHRVQYLKYEGPVSKGRGQVTMLDKGTYELLLQSDRRWEIELHGQRVQGKFALERGEETSRGWQLTRLSPHQSL